MGSLRTLKGNESQGEYDSAKVRGSERHWKVCKRMAALFGVSPDYFSKWPPAAAVAMLERAERHGCADCYWQQDIICIQSEEEENFPEECSGFRPW